MDQLVKECPDKDNPQDDPKDRVPPPSKRQWRPKTTYQLKETDGRNKTQQQQPNMWNKSSKVNNNHVAPPTGPDIQQMVRNEIKRQQPATVISPEAVQA